MTNEDIVLINDSLELQSKEEDLRQHIKSIVAKACKGLQVKNIIMLSGGITNRLYRIDGLQEGKQAKEWKVLMRINGRGTEFIINRDVERKVLRQAHLFGYGPHVYCMFDNGMVYEYLEGHALKPEEMGTRANKIASQLAKFHEMDIDVNGGKTEPSLLKQMLQWMEKVKQFQFEDDNGKKRFAKIDLDALERDIHKTANTAKDYEIGFCHNDLLSGNIVYDSDHDRLYFIDFEYSNYNYVAFDIANHFCEYAGFDANRANYPNDAEQESFIRTYLNERTNREATDEAVQTLKDHVYVGAMLSCLFWGVWGIMQARYSLIDFDYWFFVEERLDWFHEMKSQK